MNAVLNRALTLAQLIFLFSIRLYCVIVLFVACTVQSVSFVGGPILKTCFCCYWSGIGPGSNRALRATVASSGECFNDSLMTTALFDG